MTTDMCGSYNFAINFINDLRSEYSLTFLIGSFELGWWHSIQGLSQYKARYAHKRLYTVLPKYSKIQVLPGITSCRLVKDNKQAIELNSLLINNMPKDGYGWN